MLGSLHTANQDRDAEGQPGNNACGDQVIAVEGKRGDVAVAQTGQRVRIHAACSPDRIVGHDKEGSGPQNDARRDADERGARVEQDPAQRHRHQVPGPGGDVALPAEGIGIDLRGQEVVGGHQRRQGGKHLAPRPPRAEEKQRPAHSREVEPIGMRKSSQQEAAQNGHDDQQISGHGRLRCGNPP